MEVILVQPVKGLGHIGQMVKVKDGFGRNYLIPQGKAIRATEDNKERFKAEKELLEKKNAEAKALASDISTKLNDQVFNIIRQAGDDGRLFGSVSTKELTKVIGIKFANIKHSNILLKAPIKAIGIYEVDIMLHSEVQTKIYVNVARTDTEAQDALQNFTSSKKADQKTANAV